MEKQNAASQYPQWQSDGSINRDCLLPPGKGKGTGLQQLSPHIHSGAVFLVRTDLEAKLFIKRFFSLGGYNYDLDAPAFFQLTINEFDAFGNECFSDPLSLVFGQHHNICQIGDVSFIPKDTGAAQSFTVLTTRDDEI